MEIEGSTYEFTLASDVDRDGMSLWCERVDPGGVTTQVLEAFWHDSTGRFVVRFYEPELPFALVRAFVKAAAEACPPTRSDTVGTRVLIHVKLLGEAVDVWRPVTAEFVGRGTYRIIGDLPEGENWEFKPGMEVLCDYRRFAGDDSVGLVATRSAG
mgnify:CR=1 FL=1|jgi:hypothetical protein